jgi:acyl carrier protein
MEQNPTQSIHAKIVELAKTLGHDALNLKMDEEIPSTGFLDSAATMDLILWLESEYDFIIPQEDITLENLGTVNSIAAYVRRAAGSA